MSQSHLILTQFILNSRDLDPEPGKSKIHQGLSQRLYLCRGLFSPCKFNCQKSTRGYSLTQTADSPCPQGPTFESCHLSSLCLGQAFLTSVRGQGQGNATAAQQKPDLLAASVLHKTERGGSEAAQGAERFPPPLGKLLGQLNSKYQRLSMCGLQNYKTCSTGQFSQGH